MSEKYIIEWSGSTEIEADSSEEARCKFDVLAGSMCAHDLANGDLDPDVETQAKREAWRRAFFSKAFPKTEAANG